MRNSVVFPAPFGPITPTMPPGGKREGHVFNQQIVAISLAHFVSFDHDVAQTRPGRNVNLQIFAPLLRFFAQQDLRKN